jgi:hypothetical protein
MFFSTLFPLAIVATITSGHMELLNPPLLCSKYNKFTSNIDYSMTSPLGSNNDYPYKGYLPNLVTSEGASVAT